jgi:hypothetical protein
VTAEQDVPISVEATIQRVRELSVEVSVLAKQSGLVWPDGYESTLQSLLNLEERAAESCPGAEWATELAKTHAEFVRQTSGVVFVALQDRLKKVTMPSGSDGAAT